MYSALEKFDIFIVFPIRLPYLNWDLSLTNLSLYVVFVVLVIIFFSYLAVHDGKLIPNFYQVANEYLLKFVFGIVDKQIGVNGYVYGPFLFVLFLFVLLGNLFGMLPFGFAPTNHLAFTFFFSLTIWTVTVVVGLAEHGFRFFKLFVPNVPVYLLPILTVIEIASYVMRLFSLAIRLSANITAGHVLLFTLAGFSTKLFKFDILLGIIPLVIVFLVLLLELGVAFLQSYVLVTLVAIYFNDSLNGVNQH